MGTKAGSIARMAFGTAVVAALGFGAAGGLAAPAGASPAGAARACDHQFCNDYCVGAGYWGGSCVNNGAGGTKCLCF
jgi:hypothetical protein